MSRKIHHGSNGSYKTSGALADDLMPAVLAGRTVVTNIRGLTDRDQIISVYYQLQSWQTKLYWRLFPSKIPFIHFELIHLDTEDIHEGEANIEKMRRWMEWVPEKALIIMDEVGQIYDPKVFNLKKLQEYDFPAVDGKSSQQSAIEAGRWQNLNVAFQQHRHFQLDFIFTTTDYSLVHDIVKKGADMAYRHVNLANITSLKKGSYKEVSHSPINNGSSTAHIITTTTKKVPQPIFRLYKSTKTGEVQDTIAGVGMWRSSLKLRIMTYLSFIAISYALVNLPTTLRHTGILKDETESIEATSTKEKEKNIPGQISDDTPQVIKDSNYVENIKKNNFVLSRSNSRKTSFKRDYFVNNLVEENGIYVTGAFTKDDMHFIVEKTGFRFTYQDVKKLGFKISYITVNTGFLEADDVILSFKPLTQRISDFCCLNGKTTSQQEPFKLPTFGGGGS